MDPVNPTSAHFITQMVEKWLVIEFRTPSLMDPVHLEDISRQLYHLVDAQDQRRIIIDFEKVQYLSSQAIGIVLNMNKKLMALKNSKMILCGVTGRLMELIKITRLDKILTIKPTQKEAVKVVF
jgi:anti-sigma B factor antagonist